MNTFYIPAPLLLFIILGITSTYSQQPASGFDARSIRWWMTKDQVLAAEQGQTPTGQSRERLLYENVKVGDDRTNLLYEFRNDKLVSLTYIFTKLDGTVYLPYISYQVINRTVTARYGKPITNEETWRGYKNIYKPVVGYSDAIANGDLALATVWTGKRTAVTHVMNSKAHSLSYTSRLTTKPASSVR